jgi:hypothetical protein
MPVHEVDPYSIILLLIACLGMPGILAPAYDYALEPAAVELPIQDFKGMLRWLLVAKSLSAPLLSLQWAAWASHNRRTASLANKLNLGFLLGLFISNVFALYIHKPNLNLHSHPSTSQLFLFLRQIAY